MLCDMFSNVELDDRTQLLRDIQVLLGSKRNVMAENILRRLTAKYNGTILTYATTTINLMQKKRRWLKTCAFKDNSAQKNFNPSQ